MKAGAERRGGTGLDALRTKLQQEKTLLLSVRVTPRAAHSEVVGVLEDGSVKVRIAAVPEKGRANEELRGVLALYFTVPKKNVEIVSGESSQHKRVRVSV